MASNSSVLASSNLSASQIAELQAEAKNATAALTTLTSNSTLTAICQEMESARNATRKGGEQAGEMSYKRGSRGGQAKRDDAALAAVTLGDDKTVVSAASMASATSDSVLATSGAEGRGGGVQVLSTVGVVLIAGSLGAWVL